MLSRMHRLSKRLRSSPKHSNDIGHAGPFQPGDAAVLRFCSAPTRKAGYRMVAASIKTKKYVDPPHAAFPIRCNKLLEPSSSSFQKQHFYSKRKHTQTQSFQSLTFHFQIQPNQQKTPSYLLYLLHPSVETRQDPKPW